VVDKKVKCQGDGAGQQKLSAEVAGIDFQKAGIDSSNRALGERKSVSGVEY
jgi:hypothetical protein